MKKEIRISNDDLKHIYTVCGKHVAQTDTRPILKYIQLIVENGVCTATCTNTYTLAQVKTKVDGDDGEYIIPVVKVPKGMFVNIINTEKEITIDFVSSVHIERMPAGEFPDFKRFIKIPEQPTYEIGADAKLLINSLSSMKNSDYVKLTFGSNMEGFFITPRTGESYFVMQLPVNLRR